MIYFRKLFLPYVETLQPEFPHRGRCHNLFLFVCGKLNILESNAAILYQIDMSKLTDFACFHWATYQTKISIHTML
jgi:hypothetical protein